MDRSPVGRDASTRFAVHDPPTLPQLAGLHRRNDRPHRACSARRADPVDALSVNEMMPRMVRAMLGPLRFAGVAIALALGPLAALVACGARTDSWDLFESDASVRDANTDTTPRPTTISTPTTTATPTTTSTPTTTVTATGPGVVYCAPIAPPPFPTVTCSAYSACDLAPGATAPSCVPHAGPWNCGIAHCTGRCTCVSPSSAACGCAR
jgi:hypothetical protein